MSYSLRAGLAGLAAIASGLILASATPARAFEISPRIASLLRDQHACWQLERADRTSNGWKEQKELRTGRELRGMIQDDQYNAIFNPTGITSASVGAGWRTTYIYTPTHNEQNPDHPNERWRQVPCPAEPAAEAKEELPTLPALEEHSPQQNFRTGPNVGVVLSFDPVEYASGTTTFTTAFDKLTVKYHTEQAEFGGLAYAGPAFAYVKATAGFDPNGSSTDVFAGGGTFTSNVRTGMTGSVNVVGGYSVWQTPTTSFGIMGGYYGSTESLYGRVPGGMTELPIMTNTWNAGQAGVFFKQSFTAGNVPFQLWSSVTGLWDRLHSGAFTGDGGGLKANATLSFPLGPVRGRITAQYADLNASGSVLGISQKVDTQNWYVGAGISVAFGGAAAPTFPIKALPTK